MSIQEFYSRMATDELRNQQIVDDVIKAHEKNRNALILTERTAQVELLAGKLREQIPEVITLTGGRGVKETYKDPGPNRRNASRRALDLGGHRQIHRRGL